MKMMLKMMIKRMTTTMTTLANCPRMERPEEEREGGMLGEQTLVFENEKRGCRPDVYHVVLFDSPQSQAMYVLSVTKRS